MIKKSILNVILVLMLFGCGPRATEAPPAPTSTQTQAPVATESPAAVTDTPLPQSAETTSTETSTGTPAGLTATADTPRPTNEANCTNSAAFVADVTVPDNTSIGAGTPFTKTWRVSNTGTCIWASDYTLSYYSEERMNAPASVPLPLTYPGQTADISINLTAPNALGSHRGNFVIKNPAGLIMQVDQDSRLWLVINVTNDVSNATAVPGTGNSTGLVTSTCAFFSELTNVTETIDAINAYRAENGLPAYKVNSLLAKAAQSHANDMACNSLFGHTGSNGSSIQSRVAAAGYTYSSVTENVYGSYPALTGAGAVAWWKNDKSDLRHNLNLISDTYTEIGVGYSFFNNFGYYVVVFGTP
jgi:uncharacterized protein YkwD